MSDGLSFSPDESVRLGVVAHANAGPAQCPGWRKKQSTAQGRQADGSPLGIDTAPSAYDSALPEGCPRSYWIVEFQRHLHRLRHRNGAVNGGPEGPINVEPFDPMSLMWCLAERVSTGGAHSRSPGSDLSHLVKAGAVQLIATRLSGRPSGKLLVPVARLAVVVIRMPLDAYPPSTPCRKFEPALVRFKRQAASPLWSSGMVSPLWH
jgi:hypothetical protein